MSSVPTIEFLYKTKVHLMTVVMVHIYFGVNIDQIAAFFNPSINHEWKGQQQLYVSIAHYRWCKCKCWCCPVSGWTAVSRSTRWRGPKLASYQPVEVADPPRASLCWMWTRTLTCLSVACWARWRWERSHCTASSSLAFWSGFTAKIHKRHWTKINTLKV